ncbi:hypothetical protein CHARACLAT_011000, partial [Characodon lateralis]|nr:hypothetical protein [Characodon lateralis]
NTDASQVPKAYQLVLVLSLRLEAIKVDEKMRKQHSGNMCMCVSSHEIGRASVSLLLCVCQMEEGKGDAGTAGAISYFSVYCVDISEVEKVVQWRQEFVSVWHTPQIL